MISKIIDSFNGFLHKFKSFSPDNLSSDIIQSIYDSLTMDVIFTCSCPFCSSHLSLICWGYYFRTLIVFGIQMRLRVKRVRCKVCGRTQAIHISSMIPYCHVSLETMIDLLTASNIRNVHASIEDNYIYRKRQLFRKKWRDRLIAIGIYDLHGSLNHLSFSSLSNYLLQFMQNHSGNNYLSYLPT